MRAEPADQLRLLDLAAIDVQIGQLTHRRQSLPELATTGADVVSVGALTHSAPAVDVSFELEPVDA